MEETVSINLNANEAQVLINLLNIACQAKGLEAAEPCMHFSKKIQNAAQEFSTQGADEENETTG